MRRVLGLVFDAPTKPDLLVAKKWLDGNVGLNQGAPAVSAQLDHSFLTVASCTR